MIQNRAMNHLYKVHGINPEKDIIKIKNPTGFQRVGDEGVLDGSDQSSPVLRMLSSKDNIKVGEKPMTGISKKELRNRKIRNAIPDFVEDNPNLKNLLMTHWTRKEKQQARQSLFLRSNLL